MNPLLFLLGSCSLRVGAESRTAFLNLCMQYGLSFRDFQVDETGRAVFRCSLYTASRLKRACQKQGIAISVQKRQGLPELLYRYRYRLGALIGSLLAVALLLLSRQFVWDVRVVGNTVMTDSEVLEELRASGFGVGSYIPSLRSRELENRVLMQSDRISWLSLYLDGTVAVVQVIEHTTPEETSSSPANLVAACDGQIEVLMLYRGNAVVKVGQAVRKGDLLVSGLYDSASEGYRYTRAAGEVYARTERTLKVEIPFSYTERSYEDSFLDEIYLNFFDFSIKIFKRGGNCTSACDIMKKEIGMDAIGLRSVPIALEISRAVPFAEREAMRSPQTALELAYSRLEEELGSLSEEVMLLRKEITVTMTESSLILNCTVSCIENIAVSVDFEITQ